MIPLKDTIDSRFPPAMTWSIIAACIGVFAIQLALSPDAVEPFVRTFGVIPASWSAFPGNLFASLDGAALLTHMFLHGGIAHIVFNLWMLAIFGDNVEDTMGTVRFLSFYLLCGLIAVLTHMALNPGSSVPTVGASGAISGVMGAYMVLYPRAQVATFLFFWPFLMRVVLLPAFLYIGLWFGYQLLSGVLTLGQSLEGGGVAVWAHIGGFVAGVLLHRLFMIRERIPGGWQKSFGPGDHWREF